VKLAVSMASSSNKKVHTVPEDSALQAESPSTLPKKQPLKNAVKKIKAVRTVSSSVTQQPAAAEPDNSNVTKQKHRRTSSSPLRTTTGSMTIASAPATPVAREPKVLRAMSVTPKPTTRGQHLKNVKPKVKRRGSFGGTSSSSKDKDVGSETMATTATISASLHKDATQKEGIKSTVATKKKKDTVRQNSKRLSSSASQIPTVKLFGEGDEIQRLRANPPRIQVTNDFDIPSDAKPKPSVSSKPKQAATSADSFSGSGKQKQVTKSSDPGSPGEGPPKNSLPIHENQHTTSTDLDNIGAGTTRLSAEQKQMAKSVRGTAKTSIQSSGDNEKPKLKSRATQSANSLSKSPKKAPIQHSTLNPATLPKRHIHQYSKAQPVANQSELERLSSKFTGVPMMSISETRRASAGTLSSSMHGNGTSAAGNREKRSSLESSTTHGSSYAPSASSRQPMPHSPMSNQSERLGTAGHSSRTSSRPSMSTAPMHNQSERLGHQRRRSQDDAAVPKPKQRHQPTQSSSLTFFGSPLVPIDIVGTSQKRSKLNLMHHKDALEVLGEIKNMKRQQLMVSVEQTNASLRSAPMSDLLKRQKEDSPALTQPELKVIQLLKTAGTATSATLSMTGFKGGALEDQVNHDRSLIVSPFYLRNHSNSMVRRRLMGVFDGHAEHGSKFAEHCQQLLPSLLSRKLADAFKKAVEDIAAGMKKGEDEVAITKRVLAECFLSMDESSPKEASGGCTATVVYQQGQNVFVANTGDSRSFIAVYRSGQGNQKIASAKPPKKGNTSTKHYKTSPNCVKVVYLSREDKPDLPGERERLEGWGGEIIPAEGNKSAKVKFINSRPGKASATLSMSRSIGDWQFTPLGVIPDPLVDVIDIKQLVERELKATGSKADGDGGDVVDDVCIFAVSVSDGMMVESLADAEAVASELATSLFSDDGQYPLCACQSVITQQAAAWDRRNKGRFRDDITVAVTALRAPAMAMNSIGR
jgi:Protein phosphatase 2C